MKHRIPPVVYGLLALMAWAQWPIDAAQAVEEPINARWIWFNDGDTADPGVEAPAGKVWFRYQVWADAPSTGQVFVACDDHFVLWVNGHRLGEGDAGKLHRFNLSGIVDAGTNVICIEAENKQGKAGLLVDGGILYQNTPPGRGYSLSLDTGRHWKATRTPPEGDDWLKRDYPMTGWTPAREIAEHAASPWKSLEYQPTYLDRYELADGFRLQRIAEPEMVGSLVAMTWGNRGRLIASQERGPILSVIDDNQDGIYDRVVELSSRVTNCQGLCTVFGDLYAVGDGPEGVGIYRLTDTDSDDVADKVELVQRLAAHMGEHGPHDVVYGPDGWLYFNQGNMSHVAEPPQPTSAHRDYYEGYLLEPKFEDGRGHAAGVKAPGGTIWRFTPDGRKWYLHCGGFRNEYDIAFSSGGDLFSFDSDMEWDVGQPWYRPCRVVHAVAGAEFGWRSGSGKWPDYYFDSLPALVNIGRGSPTGVIVYEHNQLPKRLQGAVIICDWSLGRMIGVKLKPAGATFTAETETIITGNPLNVSDLEVDRDGSLVFVTGGRRSEGGIYRITYGEPRKLTTPKLETVADALTIPQLQSAWAREAVAALRDKLGEAWNTELLAKAQTGTPAERHRALVLLAQFGPKPTEELLIERAADSDPQVRRMAVMLLGDHTSPAAVETLVRAMADSDAHVVRRACEAMVRNGQPAPIDTFLDLLASDDRFLRFTARITLEHQPVEAWRSRVLSHSNPRVVLAGLLALYRLEKTSFDANATLETLASLLEAATASNDPVAVDILRMTQLVLLADANGQATERIAKTLLERFPAGNDPFDFEAARILARLDPPGATDKLFAQLLSVPESRQQIHYALVLHYTHRGWTAERQRHLLDWYETTKTWEGGASFVPYLANIVGGTIDRFSPQDRAALLAEWQVRPYATRLLLDRSNPDQVADFVGTLLSLIATIEQSPPTPERDQVLQLAITALGRSAEESAQAALRRLYESHPDQRTALVRALAEHPDGENWPLLVRSLSAGDPTTLQLCISGLRKVPRKSDKPADIRALILAGLTLGDAGGMNAARLLAAWTGQKVPDGVAANAALARYQQWYRQQFPNEPPPELPVADASKHGYSYDELVWFLEHSPDGQSGDIERGRQVFAKANCVKCHQFGKEGQGIGPDLSGVRRRFQKREIVESVLYPSKVISDQYRSVTVVTTNGLVHNGLPVKGAGEDANQPTDKVILLLQDATKIEIPTSEVEEILPSTLSAMPEGLFKGLTLQEIADLFAFLEISRNAPEPAATGEQ